MQTNRTGGAHDGGQQFEMKMAALIGLRGLKEGHNFKLSTNKAEFGNFDDIVYTADDRRYFLQLKHTDNPDKTKLTKGGLVTLLRSCSKSYCAIKKRKGIQIDKTEFIIYTNMELGPELSQHKRQQRVIDMIFKTRSKGEIFNFTRHENEAIDVYSLVVQDPEYPENKVSEFLEKVVIATGQKGHWELDDLIEKEIRNHDAIKVDKLEYKSILQHLKTPLENWWRNKKRKNMTPEMLTDWLQRAKTEYSTPFVRGLFVSCTKDLARTGIKFSDRKISRFQKKLPNKPSVLLRSDALTLCSILLLNCLPQPKRIFVNFECLQSQREDLLHAWLGGVWEWLIVSCDSAVQQSDISDARRKISKIIKPDLSNKRVIILTGYSVQKLRGFRRIEHKFSFELLSKESQEMVLDKKIDFQGCEVTMRSVLQRHGNVQHVLGPELVTDLVTGKTPVNIGGKLHVNTCHYVPRVLKTKIWLPLSILRNRGTYPDVFAVSGMQEKELLDNVPSDEAVGSFYFDEDSVTENASHSCMFENRRFILLKGRHLNSSFLKLRENYSRETLHWLKYKDGKLLWKETRGDISNLLECADAEGSGIDMRTLMEGMTPRSCEVTEESIWDLTERTVLVVAEPGMGKSSTTTQVARHTKERDPTSWIVRINWNDHTRKLQEIDAATFNSDTLVEFLCSAAFPDSKYTYINRSLLKQALQSSGNVTVLMDGFDEISPTYADKAAVILSELMKTKVGRVWVTSRPVMKERLEKQLSVMAYGMKKLSWESQKKVFNDIWKRKATGNKDDQCVSQYIQCLLSKAKESIDPGNFTGSPLHIRVIASAFEENLDESLKCDKICLPEKLDLLYLYDKFLKRKVHIYETEKKMEDLTKASVLDDHERLMETYLEYLEKCSLLVTVPFAVNSLHQETTGPTIRPFITRVKDGKDKIGIVMNVVEEKPHFIHRTFAEYFTARWFSKYFQSNRSVLEDILFDTKYEFVRNVFDRILAIDCPLHCAVLDRDTEAVENLLKEGSDINAQDGGGRNALHLIATEPHVGDTCKEITNSLLRRKDFVNAKDNVLQWTPLRYALKAENWFVVEMLLEKEFNRTDLEFIRQRVDDDSYIGKVLKDIEGKSYSLLLQYLSSICAKTKWAQSVEAAVARK